MRGSSKRGRLFSDGSSSAGGREFGRLTNSSDESSANISPENVPRASSSMNDDGAPEEPLSPYQKSPWSSHMAPRSSSVSSAADDNNQNALLGSLVREEGHICSLAASGDLLYTGSDSKNIRVWRNHQEFAGFKSHSGLVKAIVIAGEKIFTGHQDGKIRVWRRSTKSESLYRRHGTLPTFRDYVKHSVKPSSYIDVGKNRTGLWLKHIDAISCLCLSEDKSLLYSASWDRTFKVWRISDSKCLESVTAHEDVVNSVVAGFDELVFTGSADGTVKIWRREMQGKGTKHFFSQNLLKQECAVTALAFNGESSVVYCGSSDGVVNFWERENNFQNGGVLRGHKLAVLCLVTAAELVLSGSADMGIYVWKWNGSEHMCVSVLSGHTGPVKCLAMERDRETEGAWILYSGSLDKSVKMWRVTGRPAPGTVQGQASVDNGGSRRGSRRARAAMPACTLQDASTYVSQ